MGEEAIVVATRAKDVYRVIDHRPKRISGFVLYQYYDVRLGSRLEDTGSFIIFCQQ